MNTEFDDINHINDAHNDNPDEEEEIECKQSENWNLDDYVKFLVQQQRANHFRSSGSVQRVVTEKLQTDPDQFI